MSILRYLKLSEFASELSTTLPLDAGFDIKSAYDYIVLHGKSTLVQTDIRIKLPSGCYGKLSSRSGLVVKLEIEVRAGTIDSCYEGGIGVLLRNFGATDFHVKRGDKIEQLDMPAASNRGIQRYGSSDVKN